MPFHSGRARGVRAFVFPLLALVGSSPVHAGRPLQTEDAGILPAAVCELEAVAAKARTAAASDHARQLQLGCGIGARTQLALSVTHARDTSSIAVDARGKTAFWTGDDTASVALAYATGTVRVRGHGSHQGVSQLALVGSTAPHAGFTWHANFGHARDAQLRQRSTLWGLALEHEGWGAVAPMAELYGDDREAPRWNLGLRFSLVPERVFADLSWGRQFASSRPSVLTAGFKLAL